ncbi:phospholipid carrier-dependent glycosyltransferase [Candidatus Giovannonibacteria bacterium]|nr:phospholipid carrier-dependent glycosyltransferase [Candidatus Giovannonibacteria bacterium]
MNLIPNFLKSDLWIACGFILLAFLVRIPYLSHPQEPVFDEVHYSNFAIRTSEGENNIDLHPPFLRILFAQITKIFANDLPREVKAGAPFGNFPFIPLRLMTVITGSLLAGIIFLIAKKIYPNNSLVVLSPLLYAFDGALISYSRLILPEIYILFFGLVGFLFSLVAIDAEKKSQKLLFLMLAGVFMGVSISIKWSGLGFLAAAIILLFYKNKLKLVFPLILISLLMYILIFSVFFPPSEIIKYSAAMYRAHSTIPSHPAQSMPYFWPFGEKSFTLWGNGVDAIKLIPNFAAWAGVFISLLLSVIFFVRGPGNNHFLLGAFLVNYLPFFAISRPLFIYHYFAALIFGFLMVPGTLKFLEEMITTKKENSFANYYAALVIIFFLIFTPFIY